AKPRGGISADKTKCSRPALVSPYLWWKVLNSAQRKQWWIENDGGDGPSAPCLMGNTLDVDDDVDVWAQLDAQVNMYNDPSKILAECYMRNADVGEPVLPVATGVSRAQSWVMPIQVGDLGNIVTSSQRVTPSLILRWLPDELGEPRLQQNLLLLRI
ncbi:MAG: hypothetical protein ACKPKO_23765, partial [Candidatus Fonsibacter sp.]